MESLKKKQNAKDVSQLLLVILDGVGITDKGKEYGNAIAGANMPVLKGLWANEPCVKIQAHGKAVGMPSDEDMGNSEVGHNVLGCGRVFDQGAKLVNHSIASGEMFRGKVWKEVVSNCMSNRSCLHFLGLLSDGNVHSHIDHLKAMMGQAKKEGVSKVRVHILLDGRDVPETSALEYVRPFEAFLSELRSSSFDVKIASGGGRMTITMDRYEADWSMVERGWNVHVLGKGEQYESATKAIESIRQKEPSVIDQYLPAFVVAENGTPVGKIVDGDSVVFYNFRGDRAIEISMAFTQANFSKFERGYFPKVVYAGMMQYDGDLKLPEKFLVDPPAIDRTVSEYLVKERIHQYAISETQKYGHVTYFWNGNKSGYIDQKYETYKEITSDVIPFDQAPKMKAREITDVLVDTMKSGKYKFLRVNYPNGDMVGHTGKYNATVESLEFLDTCLKDLIETAKALNAIVLITADHGNADEMYQLDKKGNVQRQGEQPVPKTSHTLNPVNFVLYDPLKRFTLTNKVSNPGLANVAASVLHILGYEAPEGYMPSVVEYL
jgi:2,3-bisphosphoglycerate-independent phosphoglycerate mutase